MPSPITGANFDLSNFAGDVCQEITQLVGLSNTLKTWFEWAFDADGNPTQAFKDALALIPVGLVSWRPVSSVPDGWLICNGQAVSRTTYANLYSILGTQFGAGDGSTTFNLPDLQAKFLMGAGSGVAVAATGGASSQSITLSSTNLPPHDHPIGLGSTSNYVRRGLQRYWLHSAETIGMQIEPAPVEQGYLGLTELTGGTNNAAVPLTVSTVPPYAAGLWLIKY